jgi:hypothetical protein
MAQKIRLMLSLQNANTMDRESSSISKIQSINLELISLIFISGKISGNKNYRLDDQWIDSIVS